MSGCGSDGIVGQVGLKFHGALITNPVGPYRFWIYQCSSDERAQKLRAEEGILGTMHLRETGF